MGDTTKNRHALEQGYRLHWYRIDRVLGQGGFGITYLAHDTNLDQPVAIKEFLPIELAVRAENQTVHPVSEERETLYRWALDRFITEARTLAKFDHPNIVRVLAVFEENNSAYIIMRYEEGETLEHRLLERQTLSEQALLDIVLPIIDGLQGVHEAGFIHRDIKPANIFIRTDNSPVLIDFGSARQAFGEQTHTLTTLISPGYTPFEQYFTKGEDQGPWTDIYGLAGTLYHGIVGKRPIDSLERSKAIIAGEDDPLIPAMQLCQGLYSPHFLQAVDHGLEFRHQHRPQDLTSWKRALTTPRPAAIASSDAPTTPAQMAMDNDITPLAQPSPVAQPPQVLTDQVPMRPPLWRRQWFIALLIVAIVFAGLVIIKKRKDKTQALTPSQPTAIVSEPVETGGATEPQVATEEAAPPATTPVPEKSPTQQKIDRLLDEAQQALKDGNITRPRGDNAFERYREVLNLDPENLQAKQAIRAIVAEHVQAAKAAADSKKYKLAERYINNVLEMVPNNKKLRKLRDKYRRLAKQ